MYRFLSNYIILAFVFISSVSNGLFAQSLINVGVKMGGSKLIGEIPKGSTGIINEFDNKTGFAFAFEISKYISPRLEIGVDFVNSNLKGNTYNPVFSAAGVQGEFPYEISDPVEYENKLVGQNIYFRYFFKPYSSESYFIPFIKAGGGYLNYNSKFKYIEAPKDDILFGKGMGKDGNTNLSTPVFVIGTGIKTTISRNIYLLTTIDFNMVNYDFLDVVHNFDDNKKRQQITGVYTEFKIGVFYTVSIPGAKEKKDKKNNGKNKRGSSNENSYLPFSPVNKSK